MSTMTNPKFLRNTCVMTYGGVFVIEKVIALGGYLLFAFE